MRFYFCYSARLDLPLDVLLLPIQLFFLWLADQQPGQEMRHRVALLQRVDSEPRVLGPGLAESYFWGMFRTSTESPYKAVHLGDWWKVGYQRLRCFFSTRLHLASNSPAVILTPRTLWRLSSGSQLPGFSKPMQTFTLWYILVIWSFATLPSAASLQSVLLPSPHLFYIINENSASHQQDFDHFEN